MSFNPISTTVGGAKAWNEIGPGQYGESTVAFGAPRSLLRISGGKLNVKTGIVTASLSRILEKDILVAGLVTRKTFQLVATISIPPTVDFTTGLVDDSFGILSEFATLATLDRILKGEQ